MKFLYGLLLSSILTSTCLASPLPYFPNPHTSIPVTNWAKEAGTFNGPTEMVVPTCVEREQWWGGGCDEKLEPIVSTHNKLNTGVLKVINHYSKRMLNVKEYNDVAILALYNKMAPVIYDDIRSCIQYPWDVRQDTWVGTLRSDKWDWQDIEYVLEWRKGLVVNDEDSEEIKKEKQSKLQDLMFTRVIPLVPMYDYSPLPNLRSNPILPNEYSHRKDYSYYRDYIIYYPKVQKNIPMWTFADTNSTWYIPDIFNALIGELDIRYGSKDRTMVDQKYIKRHNLRNPDDTIPRKSGNIEDDMIKCWEYQNKFNLTDSAKPSFTQELSEEYKALTNYLDTTFPNHSKYYDECYTSLRENFIKPRAERNYKNYPELYADTNNVRWFVEAYMTGRFID